MLFRNSLLVLALVLILSVLFASNVFAAICSARSYVESCKQCTFDASGKMDESCRKNSENDAQSCLVTTYPRTSVAYSAGKCPQVDVCLANLKVCRLVGEKTSDKTNCHEPAYNSCFNVADTCVAKAAQACTKESDLTIFDIGPRLCLGGAPGFILLGLVVFRFGQKVK